MPNLQHRKCLALDRTNWKVGATDINILMLAIVTRRFHVPLMWTLLPHPSPRRNSHGRREKSWFRLGFDALRNWVLNHPKNPIKAWVLKQKIKTLSNTEKCLSRVLWERLQALMKRILRSGFELVMEREGRYTTSLYLHYECFARHYPDRERDMRRVLEIFLNPDSRWPEMPAFLNDFGGWLCLEASDVLSRHWRNQG